MKKVIFLVLALLLLLFVGYFIFWLVEQNIAAPAPEITEPGVSLVEINDSGFSPQTVIIKTGETIEWINKDSQPHQVVIDFGASRIEGKALQTDEEYSLRFMEEREYDYYCGIHPEMRGKIIVQD